MTKAQIIHELRIKSYDSLHDRSRNDWDRLALRQKVEELKYSLRLINQLKE